MYLKECKQEQNWLHIEEERIEIHDGHPLYESKHKHNYFPLPVTYYNGSCVWRELLDYNGKNSRLASGSANGINSSQEKGKDYERCLIRKHVTEAERKSSYRAIGLVYTASSSLQLSHVKGK